MKEQIIEKILEHNEEVLKHNKNTFKVFNRIITLSALLFILAATIYIYSITIKENLNFKIRDYFYYNHNYNKSQADTPFISKQIKELFNFYLYENLFKKEEGTKAIVKQIKELYIPEYVKDKKLDENLKKIFTNASSYEILSIEKIDGAFINPKPYTVLNIDSTYKLELLINYTNNKTRVFTIIIKYKDLINFYKNFKLIDIKEDTIYENILYLKDYMSSLSPKQIYSTLLPINPNIFIGVLPKQLIPKSIEYDSFSGLYIIHIDIDKTNTYLKVYIKLDDDKNIKILYFHAKHYQGVSNDK